MTSLNIRIKKSPGAKDPVYGSAGAACFDLSALLPDGPVTIEPGKSVAIDTGVAFELPEGHVLLGFSRSGHGFKHAIRLSNTTMVLDEDFRSTAKIKLHNDSDVPFKVSDGDRIAQAMVLPYPKVTFQEVEELSTTVRGEGGLGSTGTGALPA